MKGGFAEQQVEQRGVVCLYYEKENFLCRYAKEGGANNGIRRIGPYPSVDQVRVPGRGRHDSYLQVGQH